MLCWSVYLETVVPLQRVGSEARDGLPNGHGLCRSRGREELLEIVAVQVRLKTRQRPECARRGGLGIDGGGWWINSALWIAWTQTNGVSEHDLRQSSCREYGQHALPPSSTLPTRLICILRSPQLLSAPRACDHQHRAGTRLIYSTGPQDVSTRRLI